jgi:hypothetical protein
MHIVFLNDNLLKFEHGFLIFITTTQLLICFSSYWRLYILELFCFQLQVLQGDLKSHKTCLF